MGSERKSGILLHISSLPSEYGIGDLGPKAYQFVDFLNKSKQSYWQILPINPTDIINHHSPYTSSSAFAGNTLLISPELLVDEGLLESGDLMPRSEFSADFVNFSAVKSFKEEILDRAYFNYLSHASNLKVLADDFNNFVDHNINWLEDYALFVAIKEHHSGAIWTSWQVGLRKRIKKYMTQFAKIHIDDLHRIKFRQFIFFRQWFLLRKYCNNGGVHLIGDMPIYMNLDSADVWAHPENYKLDDNGQPIYVAGVPPDYFSDTGQLWGNPVYDWKLLKQENFGWWVDRFKFNFMLFDKVRVDHFRGLVQYWEIPSGQKTAIHGHWAPVPTTEFFTTMEEKCSKPLPIIAEDLGYITEDVREVIRQFHFSGMKVLLFAFSGEDIHNHPYLPPNYNSPCVAYTGTHDNNTVLGWFHTEAKAVEKKNLNEYFGKEMIESEVHWDFIHTAFASRAELVIIPMQDFLGLGHESRMNKPATVCGNWQWRMRNKMISQDLIKRIADLSACTERD